MRTEIQDFGRIERCERKLARFTFTRSELEDLIRLYGPEDGFVRDVREAMRWMDGDT